MSKDDFYLKLELFEQKAPYIIFIALCPMIFIIFIYLYLQSKGFNFLFILICAGSLVVIFIIEKLLIKSFLEQNKQLTLK